MKRKLYILVALMLTAIVGGGVYAATFTQTLATVSLTPAGADIATVQMASGQPNWSHVLDYVTETEILRPNAPGDQTGISVMYPNEGERWDKVDDDPIDNDATYVATNNAAWQKDLYNMQDHSAGQGIINYVAVFVYVRATGTPSQASAYVHVKTNGAISNGPQMFVNTNYGYILLYMNYNPQTGFAWTWNDIDNLQIGEGLRQCATAGSLTLRYTRATQVYAEVNYSYIPTHGNTPTGNLFTVTGYTGDQTVRVYLVNSDNLSRAYQNLNMNVYLQGSVEAGHTPNYQVLTMDNGRVTFNLHGVGGATETLSITGGTYDLISGFPGEWQADWSVLPEIYCEATQR